VASEKPGPTAAIATSQNPVIVRDIAEARGISTIDRAGTAV